MASLWESLIACLQISWFKIPCHTQVELSSLNGLRVWVEDQSPHYGISFLIVLVEDALGDKQYGISMVWVDPSQARVASMEEVVTRLTIGSSNEPDWLYALVQL